MERLEYTCDKTIVKI